MGQDQEISNLLQDSIDNNSLQFRVRSEGETLHLFIQRDLDSKINQEELLTQIRDILLGFKESWEKPEELEESSTISVKKSEEESEGKSNEKSDEKYEEKSSKEFPLKILKIQSIIEGAMQPDWQIKQSFSDLENLGEETFDFANYQPQINLSEYCFTRNKALLTSKIKPPPSAVANIIYLYHKLPDNQKLEIIPTLKEILRSSKPPSIDTETLSKSAQLLLENIQNLEEEKIRKASIWLSRYCFNPVETLLFIENFITLGPAAKKK